MRRNLVKLSTVIASRTQLTQSLQGTDASSSLDSIQNHTQFRSAMTATAKRCANLQLVFTTAYQFSVRQLLYTEPEAALPLSRIPANESACMAISEAGGNRTKDIKTMVRYDEEGYFVGVTGTKTFISDGVNCDKILVVGRDVATAQLEKPDFVLAIVEGSARTIEKIPSTKKLPFVPDIEHCAMEFKATPGFLLHKDGLLAMKRFRLIEDINAALCITAWIQEQVLKQQQQQQQMGSGKFCDGDIKKITTLSEMYSALRILSSFPHVALPSSCGKFDNGLSHQELIELHGALNFAKVTCNNAATDLLGNGDEGLAKLKAETVRDLKLLSVAQQVRDVRVTKSFERLML